MVSDREIWQAAGRHGEALRRGCGCRGGTEKVCRNYAGISRNRWKTFWTKMLGFLSQTDDGLFYHHKAVSDVSKTAELLTQRRNAGQISANKRRNVRATPVVTPVPRPVPTSVVTAVPTSVPTPEPRANTPPTPTPTEVSKKPPPRARTRPPTPTATRWWSLRTKGLRKGVRKRRPHGTP